ncbi:MAG: replicative DNA helicase [Eubacterium sp.]|nr:replicative DNA helicase [Eubacterium sp.]
MAQEVVKRIMPHSNEAEQAVIGSMLMDMDAIPKAEERLNKDDFYNRQYASLFEAMVRLYNEGKNSDLVTVKNKLEEMGVPSETVSLEFIKDILDMVSTSANVKEYADIVYEKSVMRKLIRNNDRITEQCYKGDEKLDSILEDAEKSTFDILQAGNKQEYTPTHDVVIKVINQIEEAQKSKGAVTGIPTGFKELDHKLTGLQPSDLVLIAARPSVGKTALALNIIENVAIKNEIPVAIFSVEMANDQLVRRLLSQTSMVPGQKMRVGQLSEADWSDVMAAANKVGGDNIIIDDTPGLSISEMRSKCRKFKLEHDIQLVIVDYMQLMELGHRTHSRENEISEISRSLKAIARELNVPVIALSQLNRGPEQREDKKPMLADLRESGAIEQDADVVMLMSRYYDREKKLEDKNLVVVNVAKQRNGPTGEVELVWLPDYTKFENKNKEQL